MEGDDVVLRDIEKYIGFSNVPPLVYMTFANRPFVIANDCRITNTTLESLYPRRSLFFLDSPTREDVKVFVALKIIKDIDSVMIVVNPREPVSDIVSDMLATGWVVKVTGGMPPVLDHIPVLDVENKRLLLKDIPIGWNEVVDLVGRMLEKFGVRKHPRKAISRVHGYLKKKARDLEKKNIFSIETPDALILKDYILSKGGIVLDDGTVVNVARLYSAFEKNEGFKASGSTANEYIDSLMETAFKFVKGKLGGAPDHIVGAIAHRIALKYLFKFNRDLYDKFVYGGEVVAVG